MIRLPRTDYRFAALLQFFCTAAADNLPNRCTCFFAKVYAILILEKTDALNEAVQGHLFWCCQDLCAKLFAGSG